jgi:hypothetical protein
VAAPVQNNQRLEESHVPQSFQGIQNHAGDWRADEARSIRAMKQTETLSGHADEAMW